MPPNDLNRIIDAIDALAGATSPDDAWLKADALVTDRGANALNVSVIERGSGAVFWFRSSMKTAWLTDYLAQDFLSTDALVLAARRGETQSRMTDGHLCGGDAHRQPPPALSDQLVAWDYRTLDCFAMATGHQDTVKIVTLARAWDAPDPTPSERVFAALIATTINAPIATESPGATPFQLPDLSVRERDVLRYLATGLRNDMIAWKLGIAEVTVRAYIASARQKVGAATREQAIAIALRAGLLAL